jgi:hypothetical protein
VRLRDLENEELRHVLAHLWCAFDELLDVLDLAAPGHEVSLETARRHLVDCEAQIFLEDDDGAHALPQGKAQEASQAEGADEA